MLPGDRLVCAFIEPQAVGAQFKAWLFHVTIVPWFRLDAPSDDISAGLARAVSGIQPFQAVVGYRVMLGPRKNQQARLIMQPTSFTQLEARVRAYLHKKRALLIDETTKQTREFRPHVTAQGGVGLKVHEAFWCDRFCIVEQHGAYKEVVSEVVLQ